MQIYALSIFGYYHDIQSFHLFHMPTLVIGMSVRDGLCQTKTRYFLFLLFYESSGIFKNESFLFPMRCRATLFWEFLFVSILHDSHQNVYRGE